MKIIDISLPLGDSVTAWPGDTPFEYRLTWKQSAETSVNVGAITMSTHFATHIDAPFHFLSTGQKIEELDLGPYLGSAVVVDSRGLRTISRKFLEDRELLGATRLLLRTDTWTDTRTFPSSIPVMDEDVPDWLHRHGIVLIGVDVPSVDPLDSKDLPIHHALARNRIAILESINLQNVDGGLYELIALPLRIVGADGSPVRAILRSL
jgi:arylformamidase